MNAAERERLADLMVMFMEGVTIQQDQQDWIRNIVRLYPHQVYEVFQEVM